MNNTNKDTSTVGGGLFDLGSQMMPGGHIDEIEHLTPTSMRIRLAGPKLVGQKWQPGDRPLTASPATARRRPPPSNSSTPLPSTCPLPPAPPAWPAKHAPSR